MTTKTLDHHLRASLHDYLKKGHAGAPGALIIDELVLQRKDGRADVAVIDDFLHCYEIKSGSDKLDPLKRQVRVYGKVFDYLSVVTTKKHVAHATKAVPKSWGIFEWEETTTQGYDARITQLRAPTLNDKINLSALIQLLWRESALDLLRTHAADKGVSSRPKWFLWGRVKEVCTQQAIHAAVREQMKQHRRLPKY